MKKINIDGTSFQNAYLDVSLQTLIDKFGNENEIRDKSSNSKVTYEWAFEIGPRMIMTIYDYKNPPIDEDSSHRWHIGGKNLSPNMILNFLSEYGFKSEDITIVTY